MLLGGAKRTHLQKQSGVLHNGFWSGQKTEQQHRRGVGKRTRSKTRFWEGCHSCYFPLPSFSHGPQRPLNQGMKAGKAQWKSLRNLAPLGCRVKISMCLARAEGDKLPRGVASGRKRTKREVERERAKGKILFWGGLQKHTQHNVKTNIVIPSGRKMLQIQVSKQLILYCDVLQNLINLQSLFSCNVTHYRIPALLQF